jgi:hypothetical protein
MLNKISSGDAAHGLPGVAALLLLRQARQGHERHIRKLNRAHDLGGFNRLHPDSPLARRVSASPTSDIPANQRDDARDDRYVSELRAERVRDTGGMDADRRTRGDFWDGQDIITLEEMRARTLAALHRRYW